MPQFERTGIDIAEKRHFASKHRLAILTVDCFDEWLDEINVNLDGLSSTMSGGWFNCLQALQGAGANCVLYATSSKVNRVTRIVHQETGALICLLPCSSRHQWFKRQVGRFGATAASQSHIAPRRKLLFRILNVVADYTSLPVIRFFKEVRSDECECLLVEQYGTPRFGLCVLFGRLFGIPVFGQFASKLGEAKGLLGHLAYPLRWLSYKMCDGFVIATSEEIERVKRAYSLSPSRFGKIAYPVDTEHWHAEDKKQCREALGIAPDDRVAIWHGGIDVWTKGLDVLAAAWRRLNAEGSPTSPWKLLIVGGASQEETKILNSTLEESGVTGVTFVDQWILDRDLLRRYLSAANVYVFPSRSDAFGISALEAMACQCPLIISTGAGACELVSSDETAGGLVVKSEDPAALAAAIYRLMSDVDLATALGREARKTVVASASMGSVGSQLVEFLFSNSRRSALGSA